jgi:hypothetical protein
VWYRALDVVTRVLGRPQDARLDPKDNSGLATLVAQVLAQGPGAQGVSGTGSGAAVEASETVVEPEARGDARNLRHNNGA